MGTARVDRTRQHSLAGAAFAAQEKCSLGRGRPERHFQSVPHGRFHGQEVGFRDNRADLLFQLFDVRLQAADSYDAFEHPSNFIRGERFGKKVERPAPHGFDRRLDRGVGGDDHHRQPGGQSQQRQEHVEPFLAPQFEIEKGDVKQAVPQ